MNAIIIKKKHLTDRKYIWLTVYCLRKYNKYASIYETFYKHFCFKNKKICVNYYLGVRLQETGKLNDPQKSYEVPQKQGLKKIK